ncbi:conserved hypothetical protein [delta proteobacterium NaphS2]|nr:conserved hypothetical protein [delta proteobacterium NaphS2]
MNCALSFYGQKHIPVPAPAKYIAPLRDHFVAYSMSREQKTSAFGG